MVPTIIWFIFLVVETIINDCCPFFNRAATKTAARVKVTMTLARFPKTLDTVEISIMTPIRKRNKRAVAVVAVAWVGAAVAVLTKNHVFC